MMLNNNKYQELIRKFDGIFLSCKSFKELEDSLNTVLTENNAGLTLAFSSVFYNNRLKTFRFNLTGKYFSLYKDVEDEVASAVYDYLFNKIIIRQQEYHSAALRWGYEGKENEHLSVCYINANLLPLIQQSLSITHEKVLKANSDLLKHRNAAVSYLKETYKNEVLELKKCYTRAEELNKVLQDAINASNAEIISIKKSLDLTTDTSAIQVNADLKVQSKSIFITDILNSEDT